MARKAVFSDIQVSKPGLFKRACHQPMHLVGIVALDEQRLIPVAEEEVLDLFVT